VALSNVFAYLATYLEASIDHVDYQADGRTYRSAVIRTPRSDFIWKIAAPTWENGQSFMLTPMRDRGGEFVPAGCELWCVTREEIAFLMLNPYGRATGLYRGTGD